MTLFPTAHVSVLPEPLQEDVYGGATNLRLANRGGTVCVFRHGFCCVGVSIVGLRLLSGARFRQKVTLEECHWGFHVFAPLEARTCV